MQKLWVKTIDENVATSEELLRDCPTIRSRMKVTNKGFQISRARELIKLEFSTFRKVKVILNMPMECRQGDMH